MSKNKYILTRNKLNDFFTNRFETFFENDMTRFIDIFVKENIALYSRVAEDIDNEFVNDERFAFFLMLDVRHKLEKYKIYIPGLSNSYRKQHNIDYKNIDFPETLIPGNDEIKHDYFMSSQRNIDQDCLIKKMNDRVRRESDLYDDDEGIAVTSAYECDCDTTRHRPIDDARAGFGMDHISRLASEWKPGKGNLFKSWWWTECLPMTYCYATKIYRGHIGGSHFCNIDDDTEFEKEITIESHFDKCELYDFFYQILQEYAKDVVFKENPEMYKMSNMYPFTTATDAAIVPEQFYTTQEIYKQIVGNLITTLNIRDIQTYIYNHKNMRDLKALVYLSALDSVSKFYKNVASTSTSQFTIKCLKDHLLKSNGEVASGNRMPNVQRDGWCNLPQDVSSGNNAAISAGSEYMLYETISSLFNGSYYRKIGDRSNDYTAYNGATSFFAHIAIRLSQLFMVEASLSVGEVDFKKDDFKAYIDTYPEWFEAFVDEMDARGTYFTMGKNEMEFINDTIDSLSGAIAGLTLATFQFRAFLEICKKKNVYGTREQLVRLYHSRYSLLERSLNTFEEMAYNRGADDVTAGESKILVRLADLLCLHDMHGFLRDGIRTVNNRMSEFVKRVNLSNESDERVVNDLANIVAPLVSGDDPVIENFVKDEDVNIMNLEEKCEEGLDFLTLAQANGDDDFKIKAAKRLMALEDYYDKYLKDYTEETMDGVKVISDEGESASQREAVAKLTKSLAKALASSESDEGLVTDTDDGAAGNPKGTEDEEVPVDEKGGEEGEDKPDVKAVAKAALNKTKNPEVKKAAKKILSKKDKKKKVKETMEALIAGLK